MQPCLLVIGLNYRTAPATMRERFWIAESRRYEALVQLCASEGVEEAVVLVTSNRTEFILWTSDVSVASNSVLMFLTREYGLRLCEWKNFYRKMDEDALGHIFRVVSGLDSKIVGESEVAGRVLSAWAQAQTAGATGVFLDALFAHSATVSQRVRAAGLNAAEQVIEDEVRHFSDKRRIFAGAPHAALRERLEDLVRLEFEQIRREAGALTTEQEQWMEVLGVRIAERITHAMLRDAKRLPGEQQETQTTAAVQRLLRSERERALPRAQN